MKSPISDSSSEETTDGAPTSAFRIAVVCANEACAEKAAATVRNLEERLETQFDMLCDCWMFESLRFTDELVAASRSGASADMIMVATLASETLPQAAIEWLQTSLKRNDREKLVLVALLEGALFEGREVESLLERIADSANADFLVNYFSPLDPASLGSTAHISERITKMTSVLDGILRQTDPAARSGIHL
ncbi:MAG: hypothetical protein EXS31_15930 [Pedosphaera sp.]|nr:hypothetical protein [Pedosphaera sp.]